MVGGTVIEVVSISKDKVWINTQSKLDKCGVYLNPQGFNIQPGDSIWWQGKNCYWTPMLNPEGAFDIPLPKIGYSGVPKPS